MMHKMPELIREKETTDSGKLMGIKIWVILSESTQELHSRYHRIVGAGSASSGL